MEMGPILTNRCGFQSIQNNSVGLKKIKTKVNKASILFDSINKMLTEYNNPFLFSFPLPIVIFGFRCCKVARMPNNQTLLNN